MPPRATGLLLAAILASVGGCQNSTGKRATQSPPALTPTAKASATGPASAPPRRTAPNAAPIGLALDTRHPGPTVPRDFLGLSFEASSLPLIASYGSHGDLTRLLRSLGTGLLRFGGVSADTQAAWTDAQTPQPAWASTTIDNGDLLGLARLARASGWRIVLTIGLGHFEPGRAGREARAAEQILKAELAGVELGNEPDAYGRHRLRTPPWTLERYDADIDSYRLAIAKAAAHVTLFGPDLSGSLIFTRWGTNYAHKQRPSMLTGHHYPLGCRQTDPPSIARLLSEPIRRAEDQSLRRYMDIARRTHIPFRLDETGSVSCGGAAGISDTFASTLWALDYIAHAIQSGAAGINFEGNPARCSGHSPLCAATARALAQGQLTAQPEWYALAAARRLIGDRPVRLLHTATHANLDALATLSATGALHLLVLNDETTATLTLCLPGGYRRVRGMSLTAASPASTRVRLGKALLTASRCTAFPQPRGNRARRLTLTLAPTSAVLLTLRRKR